MVKRYMLFAGAYYYASGGAYDYISSFDTKEEAVDAGNKELADVNKYKDWYNIIDTVEDEILDLANNRYDGGYC